jgi:hypothetical protein
MHRPKTLADIAAQSPGSITQFHYNLRNWTHELALWRDKKEALAAVTQEPPSLARNYKEGKEADATLAAYAQHTCQTTKQHTPKWVETPIRFLPTDQPVFDLPYEGEKSRKETIKTTPPAFSRRNIFCGEPDFPIHPFLTHGLNPKKFKKLAWESIPPNHLAEILKLTGKYKSFISNNKIASAHKSWADLILLLGRIDPGNRILNIFDLANPRHRHYLPTELENALTTP